MPAVSHCWPIANFVNHPHFRIRTCLQLMRSVLCLVSTASSCLASVSTMGQPLKIPFHFEEKLGSGASATYLARGPGFTLALQPEEVRLALTRGESKNREFCSTMVGLRFVGASPQPEL